jgi:hypothetical protein
MPNFSIVQIILVFVSSAIILQTIFKYLQREQSQTFFKFITAMIIWGGIFIFTIFPAFSHTITHTLGFGENLNTLIFLGFIVVFLVLTKVIRIIERIERNISEIVRKEALEKLDK